MSKLSDQVVEQIQNGEIPEDTIHDLHPTDEELEQTNRLEEEKLILQQEAQLAESQDGRKLQKYQLKQLIAYFALKNLSQMGIEQVVQRAMEDKSNGQ